MRVKEERRQESGAPSECLSVDAACLVPTKLKLSPAGLVYVFNATTLLGYVYLNVWFDELEGILGVRCDKPCPTDKALGFTSVITLAPRSEAYAVQLRKLIELSKPCAAHASGFGYASESSKRVILQAEQEFRNIILAMCSLERGPTLNHIRTDAERVAVEGLLSGMVRHKAHYWTGWRDKQLALCSHDAAALEKVERLRAEYLWAGNDDLWQTCPNPWRAIRGS